MDLPVRKTMCATCPWREGSPYASLQAGLTASALTEACRICHSTGSNAIFHETGKPEHLCRGAREVQLRVYTALKVLAAPTDEEWNAARVRCGLAPIVVKNP